MRRSLGQRLFVFCCWMMAIVMLPFALATLINLLNSVH